MFPVTAVTAEKDFSAAVFDDPARPERFVTVFQRSAGKVTTRCGSDGGVADLRAFVPVKFTDVLRLDPEGPEPRTHTEGRDKDDICMAQRPDRIILQVVVMIVGDDDEIQLRQFAPPDGGLAVTGDDPGNRCGVAEDRIRHKTGIAQLKDQAGMTQPVNAERILERSAAVVPVLFLRDLKGGGIFRFEKKLEKAGFFYGFFRHKIVGFQVMKSAVPECFIFLPRRILGCGR